MFQSQKSPELHGHVRQISFHPQPFPEPAVKVSKDEENLLLLSDSLKPVPQSHPVLNEILQLNAYMPEPLLPDSNLLSVYFQSEKFQQSPDLKTLLLQQELLLIQPFLQLSNVFHQL